MAKHIPGPYRIEIDGTSTGRGPVILGEEGYYDDGSPRQIAELEPSETQDRGKGWVRKPEADEIEATARLFAAAPDLLEALEWAQRVMVRHKAFCPAAENRGKCNCGMQRIHDAIAKATEVK